MAIESISNEAWIAYLQTTVQEKKRNIQFLVKQVVLPFIQTLNENVARQNDVYCRAPMFSNQKFPGLEVKSENEFEVVIPLKGFENYRYVTGQDKYFDFFEGNQRLNPESLRNDVRAGVVLMKTSDTMRVPAGPGHYSTTAPSSHSAWMNNDFAAAMVHEGYVVSYFGHRQFLKLISERGILRHYDREFIRDVSLLKSTAEPALRLKLMLTSSKQPNPIFVAICLTLPTQLPLPSSSDWPRVKTRHFLDSTQISQVQKAKVNDVPCKPFYWKNHYGEHERLLLDILRNHGKAKNCYTILKTVRDQFWIVSDQPAVVTSTVLKNILFWECEERKQVAQHWSGSNINRCVIDLLNRLVTAMEDRCVPAYFHSQVNLLKDVAPPRIDADLYRIRRWRENAASLLGGGSVRNNPSPSNCVANISNTELGKFLNESVRMKRDERTAINQIIGPFVQRLASALSEQDPVYSSQPHHAGSMYKRTAVTHPDEYDIHIELKPFDQAGQYSFDNRPRYYAFLENGRKAEDEDAAEVTTENDRALQLKRTAHPSLYLKEKDYSCTFVQAPRAIDGVSVHRHMTDVTFDGDVISYYAHRKFRHAVETVTKNNPPELRDGDIRRITIGEEYSGPSIKLTLHLNKNVGKKAEIREVAVDLNVSLPLHMKLPNSWNWPRRETYKWLTHEKINEIKEKDLSVVPQKPYYWDLAEDRLTKALLDGIDQPDGCRVELLRILKTMRDRFWRGDKDWDVLKSFMLENLLFWECEKFPDSTDWSPDKRAERFLGLMQSLMNCLAEGELLHYFNPEYNILEKRREPSDIREQLQILHHFMAMPVEELLN